MAEKVSYEDKEKRLNEILERLDQSETPMDELASDVAEAAQLLKSMRATLQVAQKEIDEVFRELDAESEDGSTPS